LKTHVSPHFFEFTKRIFWKGIEITPFPCSALREVGKQYYLLTNFLMELEKLGCWVTREGIPSTVANFFGTVKNLPSRFRSKMRDSSRLLQLILMGIRAEIPAEEAINLFSVESKTPLPKPITNDIANNVFGQIAMEAFVDSNPENDNFKKASKVPLGGLSEALVMLLTGLDEERQMIGLCSVHALPHLGVYGQIEEVFMKMKKEALRIDRDGGTWTYLLRSMALPLDDTLFTERSSRLIVRAGCMLIPKLKTKIAELTMY